MADWPSALAAGWHPVAYASELRRHPLTVRLMGRPIVLFRDSGGVAALEDRCPHRNAPLSAGRIEGEAIACPYHGWRFDRDGGCVLVPGSAETARARATPVAVREAGALIWASLAERPGRLPQLPPQLADPGFDSFWWPLPASRAALRDAIENLLDPLHPYFLHPGLVRRSGGPGRVEIEFAIDVEGATAIYTEPRAGMTWLQRLTERNRTVSWGRYRAPTQVQIGFEDQRGVHATITVVFAPLAAQETRPYASFSTRKGFAPAWLKRAFITLFHARVLGQDLAMLKLQADQADRFGGAAYHNGPLDLFGPAITAGLAGRALTPARRQLVLEPGA